MAPKESRVNLLKLGLFTLSTTLLFIFLLSSVLVSDVSFQGGFTMAVLFLVLGWALNVGREG